MRAYYLPIHSTSVATFYLVDIMQRQGSNIHTEIGVKLVVHLMLGKPKRKHGYLVREVEKFNSKELFQTDARTINKVEHLLRRTFLAEMQNIHFKQAQLLISDNQEITTTTSWVEELHLAHSYHQPVATIDDRFALVNKLILRQNTHIKQILLLLVKLFQFLIFPSQIIHKEWIDYLHDIRHTGVMHTFLGTHIRIHHRLNHTTENIRIDVLPIQVAAFDDNLSSLITHLWDRNI